MGRPSVAATVLFAVAGTLLVRRSVGTEVLKLNNEVAGFIYAVIGVVYAVLLGFTAIIVWEKFDQVEAVVEREASELADLYRDSRTFPDDVQREVETHLRDYAQVVVDKEWPAMAEGTSSPEAWNAYNQLWRTYYRFQPQSEGQKIWFAQSLTRLNELGDQRRLRLLGSQEAGACKHCVVHRISPSEKVLRTLTNARQFGCDGSRETDIQGAPKGILDQTFRAHQLRQGGRE